GGGTGIPTFGGGRNLAKMRAAGPRRVVFSDNSASMEIACADESIVLTVRNEANEGIDFQIALAQQAKVKVDGNSASVSRDNTTLLFQGIDRADDESRIIVKLEPHKSREI